MAKILLLLLAVVPVLPNHNTTRKPDPERQRTQKSSRVIIYYDCNCK
jgi:hypothetical protein